MDKKVTYDFGEKEKEGELTVWQSPKYLESKEKAIEMINSGKYNLSTADFWILMNKTKTGKMAYTGLIISHNGCLKINDAIDNKVIPGNFKIDKEGYKDSLIVSYVDDEVCEFGEVSPSNCKNEYPYAMAFKRCFDRVVLKKSKLAYSGIYSDSEADEFREIPDETRDITNATEKTRFQKLDLIFKYQEVKNVNLDEIAKAYKVEDVQRMTDKQLDNCIELLIGKYGEV
jgi:hypothetical protein